MARGFGRGNPSKNMWAFLHQLFDSQGALGLLGVDGENLFWVDPTNGSDNASGNGQDVPLLTITRALALIAAKTDPTRFFIMLAPGQYDESPTVARALSDLTIIGYRGRGSAYIEPSTEDASGLTVHADDVTLINVGCAGEDETSAVALTVTGSRFRAYGCKLEGGLDQLVIGPGTVLQEAAGTRGVGADSLFDDCEFAWGTNGINITCTDYGAVTQMLVRNCRFHNLTAKHIKETVGSGGSAAVTFRNVEIFGNFFDDLEDGTAPTNYIDLNGDNANTGVAGGNWFPTAINSGLNLVSTTLHWISNYHTGGVSTAQPS